MADILDELIKGGVDQGALVDQLRNQLQYGTAGALSGSKRLAGPGAALRDEAMSSAQNYRTAQDRKAAAAQENALEAMKAKMAAADKSADRAQRAADAAANRANMRGIAQMKEGGANKRAAMKAKASGKAPVALTPDQLDQQANQFDYLADIAGQGIQKTGVLNAGFASLSKIVPGSPANDLDMFLEPLRSNEALGKLAELKALSKTGASGLGSVTEREIDLLMSSIVSLKTSQGPQQLRSNLALVQKKYAELGAKLRAGKAEAANAAAAAQYESDGEDEAPVGDEFDALMQEMTSQHPELAEMFQ